MCISYIWMQKRTNSPGIELRPWSNMFEQSSTQNSECGHVAKVRFLTFAKSVAYSSGQSRLCKFHGLSCLNRPKTVPQKIGIAYRQTPKICIDLEMAFQIAQTFNVPLDEVFQYPGGAES